MKRQRYSYGFIFICCVFYQAIFMASCGKDNKYFTRNKVSFSGVETLFRTLRFFQDSRTEIQKFFNESGCSTLSMHIALTGVTHLAKNPLAELVLTKEQVCYFWMSAFRSNKNQSNLGERDHLKISWGLEKAQNNNWPRYRLKVIECECPTHGYFCKKHETNGMCYCQRRGGGVTAITIKPQRPD
ncbi:uncharacterized protein LOC111086483 [Limulus polyphemus]|uniref:Uncharacterized protein LOC111086483 n=1 Tax=Limulus polyphemus TaxID=6850 RepID=A0ABM1SNM4_LIMPO|nr:uncharacterized protein LOC111086483 [Limulus polyphemus]